MHPAWHRLLRRGGYDLQMPSPWPLELTDGDLLRGVRYRGDRISTQSIVMRSRSGTVRVVEAEHVAEKWSKYSR